LDLKSRVTNSSIQPTLMKISLPPEQFATAFPFHFALDLNLNLLQVGASLHRICPDFKTGVPLAHIFNAVRPIGTISLDWIQNHRNQVFLLEAITRRLVLRGEFMELPGQEILMFLGSPWFGDSSEIVAMGLKSEDFAIHDPMADMLQIFGGTKVALADAKELADSLTDQLEEPPRANEPLRKGESDTHQLALIAERTDNSVVLTNPTGKISWVNKGFTRLTGYQLEEVVGHSPGSILQGPDTNPATVQHMHDQLCKGEGFKVEIINYTKSGRKYWLSSEVQPIRDAAGRIVNYMAIQSDITERKQAEGALQAEVARRRTLFDQSADGIVIIDPQTARFLEFNTAAHEQLGYTRDAFARLSIPDVECLETLESTLKRIAGAVQSGRVDFETLQRTRQGQIRNVHVTAQLVKVPGQTVYQCIWRDTTERKAVEEKLRQLSRAVEQSPVSIVITNAFGAIEYVNPKCIAITGYSEAELLGQNPRVLKSGETSPVSYRELWESITTGKDWQGEFHNRRKNGELYWEDALISPIRDSTGRITHFLAIKEDITERKRSQELLLKTSTLQRGILESAGYAIIATDTRGMINLFNPAAERMLGYTAAEMVGQKTPEAFHVAEEVIARAEALTAEFGRVVKPGFEALIARAELGQPDQGEWTYVHKRGSRFPVLLSVTTLFAERGTITGYLGVASDLTDRKRDEEKLRTTLSELERFNRLMLNREERVLELKREINQLLAASGLPTAYPSAVGPQNKMPPPD
jgi:PAS domain S-box-containing protein